MKIRSDFVSNSSSTSFVFVVKSYNDIEISDYTEGFDSLIVMQVQEWLNGGTCKIVEDTTFLNSWWLGDNHYDNNTFHSITSRALEILPKSLYEKLLALGCVECEIDHLYWQGNKHQRLKIIELLKNFIIENHQDDWCLCEFTASDHDGETEITEDDGWCHVPSDAIWSTTINNH